MCNDGKFCRSASVSSYLGPVKNPWKSNLKNKLKHQKPNPDRHINDANFSNVNKDLLENDDFYVAGGSSGGGAVAVATGCCFGYANEFFN